MPLGAAPCRERDAVADLNKGQVLAAGIPDAGTSPSDSPRGAAVGVQKDALGAACRARGEVRNSVFRKCGPPGR